MFKFKLFTTYLATLFIYSVAQSSAAETLKGKFLFLNGDSLSAEIIEWKDQTILVKHPYLLDECELKRENLLEIQLQNTSKKAVSNGNGKEPKYTTTIKIKPRYKASNDNDTIRGELVQNDENYITVRTPYAGLLKIQRSKILNLDIDTKSNLLYDGPNSIEEWHNTLHNSSWSYRKGALYSSDRMGNISKDLNMPDQISLSFDHHWKTSAYLSMKLFSDDHKASRPNNYYELSIRHGSIYVRKVVDGRFMQMNAQKQNFQAMMDLRRAMASEKSAHYDIYIDKAKGLVHLFINGNLINTYMDPAPNAKKFGTALHLVSGDNSPIKLINIKMSQWSGNMPNNDNKDAFKKLKGTGQRILLKNGDAILGKTGAINDGLMEIETSYGPMKLRVRGMRSIDLSDTPEDAPKMYKGDIKLHYNEGGWIIVKPISMKGSKLKAFHQAFGETTFDLNAFKQIDMQIYNAKHNKARVPDSW